MKGLTKELRGNISFENKNGVTIIVRFKYDILKDLDQLEDSSKMLT
jgi:hypothetical protein